MASAAPASASTNAPSSLPSEVDEAIRAASSTTKPTAASISSLQTPQSATYPSSISSPLPDSNSQSFLKANPGVGDSLKTPLTPPSAYFDFLRILSPATGTSPLSTSTSTHFSFNAGCHSPACPISATGEKHHSSSAPPATRRHASSTSSRGSSASSDDTSASLSSASSSALSAAAGTASRSSAPPVANSGKPISRPSTAVNAGATATTATCPPPTSAPRDRRSSRSGPPPRRPSLVIPPSPSSTVTPMSANPSSSTSAPAGTTISAGHSNALSTSARTPWSTKSPWSATKSPFAGASSTQSPVRIRHVVTRTITYSRPARGASQARKTQSGKGDGQTPPADGGDDDAQKPEHGAKHAHDPEEQEQQDEEQAKPLVGEAPKGKRRKVA